MGVNRPAIAQLHRQLDEALGDGTGRKLVMNIWHFASPSLSILQPCPSPSPSLSLPLSLPPLFLSISLPLFPSSSLFPSPFFLTDHRHQAVLHTAVRRLVTKMSMPSMREYEMPDAPLHVSRDDEHRYDLIHSLNPSAIGNASEIADFPPLLSSPSLLCLISLPCSLFLSFDPFHLLHTWTHTRTSIHRSNPPPSPSGWQ